MSSESNSAVSGTRKPKYVFWVDTFFLDLSYNKASKDTEVCFINKGEVCLISKAYDLSLLDYKIHVEVTKLKDCDIEVSCVRYPSNNSTTGKGYILRFYFTIIGVEVATKSADMISEDKRVSVSYSSDCFTREQLEGFISYNWQLKIVVRMFVYGNLPTELNANYDDIFQVLMPKVFESEEKKGDLAFLLRLPTLSDLFTRRNNGLFGTIRATFISRTGKYSSELVEYLKAKKRHDTALPKLNFSEILNWILRGVNGPIEKKDIIVAFLKSYRLGLNFLKVITTAYILSILKEDQDLGFAVDIIQAADLVDDPILFDKVFSIFKGKWEAIMQSEKWKQVEEETNSLARSVVHGLNIRLNSRGESIIDPELYEKSNAFQRLDASKVLELYGEKMQCDNSDIILDIGCGVGDVTSDILAPTLGRFELLLGVDRSQGMVNFANEKNSRDNIHYKVLDIAGDVTYFEEDWGPFSKIYSFYCLHWIKDLKKALSNISYLMRKNGQCLLMFVAQCPVFTMYERMSLVPKWKEYMLDVNEFVPDTHHNAEPSDMFSQMMEEVGFNSIDCKLLPRSFTFTPKMLRECVVAINPFVKRVPESQRNDYVGDCIQTLFAINQELGLVTENESSCFSYKLLVAHGSTN